jgi:hypothetical protein
MQKNIKQYMQKNIRPYLQRAQSKKCRECTKQYLDLVQKKGPVKKSGRADDYKKEPGNCRAL